MRTCLYFSDNSSKPSAFYMLIDILSRPFKLPFDLFFVKLRASHSHLLSLMFILDDYGQRIYARV